MSGYMRTSCSFNITAWRLEQHQDATPACRPPVPVRQQTPVRPPALPVRRTTRLRRQYRAAPTDASAQASLRAGTRVSTLSHRDEEAGSGRHCRSGVRSIKQHATQLFNIALLAHQRTQVPAAGPVSMLRHLRINALLELVRQSNVHGGHTSSE
ncbi:hypothetical protein IXO675_004365 [Xanthomonas oryzae pv. oryzae]|nr:hypothetical protein [Xanthomonas oryzae]UXW15779.1 hypothetical protein IXO365_019315 [Xanthomonas oryzae pv. oryzae]UXW39601.1 hypothetical protein IXO675_004365 [Xanthomonas oryzae pv. oryzae]UXW43670.1 hypothetical protein IXO685_0007130 [Xanthomonas oryzae pv. oryzae]UZK21207.1 hypothetical protein DXO233_04290 [Xanthomonas oryzae pv. oryzae]WDN37067.1 hypothetical protein LL926_19400 [Xanthomonas oryzae]